MFRFFIYKLAEFRNKLIILGFQDAKKGIAPPDGDSRSGSGRTPG